jgi:DNA replication factor GINS
VEDVYERLLDAWKKERSASEVVKISEELLENLAEYLAQLRRQLKLSDKDSVNAQLKTAELEMLQKLLQSLLQKRMHKIITAVFQKTPLDNLLPAERKTYNALQRTISQHEAVIKSGLVNPRDLLKESEHKHEVVVFLKDFPKFVGEDLNSYGPFRAGDVAAICSGNVPSLVRRNIVRLVKSV